MTHDESPAAAAAATTINRDPGGPVPCLCVVGMHRLQGLTAAVMSSSLLQLKGSLRDPRSRGDSFLIH